MMRWFRLPFRFLLLGAPAMLVLMVALRLLPAGRWPAWASPASYGVLSALTVLLAFRFNRSNVLAQVLTIFGIWLLGPGAGSRATGPLAPALLWTFAACNLALTDWMKDRGVLSLQSLLTAMLLVVETGLVLFARELVTAGLRLPSGSIALRLPSGSIALRLTEHSVRVPVLTLVATACCLVFLVVRYFRNGSPTTAAVTWSALLVAVTYPGVLPGVPGTLLLAAAVLALLSGLVEQSFRMAYVDELTGIPGRRALHEALERLPARYAIAMADVDHFKRFNDQWGHETGDQVLKRVAAALQQVKGGRVYRYGGEEFAVLFPGKDADAAAAAMDDVRKRIRESGFTVRDRRERRKGSPARRGTGSRRARTVTITFSAGVAAPDRKHRTPAEVLKAADHALYRAKRAGRNRVLT